MREKLYKTNNVVANVVSSLNKVIPLTVPCPKGLKLLAKPVARNLQICGGMWLRISWGGVNDGVTEM